MTLISSSICACVCVDQEGWNYGYRQKMTARGNVTDMHQGHTSLVYHWLTSQLVNRLTFCTGHNSSTAVFSAKSVNGWTAETGKKTGRTIFREILVKFIIVDHPEWFVWFCCGLIWVGFTYIMVTSSSGNFFCVTGHLCGEFTGPRWFPHTKASDADLWWFLWSTSE